MQMIEPKFLFQNVSETAKGCMKFWRPDSKQRFSELTPLVLPISEIIFMILGLLTASQISPTGGDYLAYLEQLQIVLLMTEQHCVGEGGDILRPKHVMKLRMELVATPF